MTAEYKLTTPPVDFDNADGLARNLLDGAKANLGFVPNMYLGMAINPGMLSTYLHGYDHFRKSGNFTPPEQEVVFLTVSRSNGCDYCTAAHSTIAVNKSGLSEANTQAVRDGTPIEDARLDSLASFTAHMWETRGMPSKAAASEFKAAGYGDAHILEIILALAVKTISNYANHVNHTDLDPAFAKYAVKESA